MQWPVIIVLAILIIVIAYALGTYLRRRQGDLPDLPHPKPAAPAAPRPRNVNDREVKAVIAWLLTMAFEQTGVKVADDKAAYQRIVEAAEKAVQELKTRGTYDVSLPYLVADASGPKHLDARLTREMIEELVKY